jgi:hypothetical protein
VAGREGRDAAVITRLFDMVLIILAALVIFTPVYGRRR